MSDKMREEFEREWGQVDAAQGVHFIPELNTYGSELYAQHEYAQMKSSAWFYFQKGWKASREALVIELPELHTMAPDDDRKWHGCRNSTIRTCARAIEAVGLKVKP
ncbi:hypothetical protein C4J88_2943 [Pseudomonas sp. R4-39-08]|uniref:hypothetical protein n=1 Tax=Pseudomonas sp. R4-39-08 TaxID=1173288 RepID=UPI000F5634B7|nr:hypothetical protein [Pseudomonas sp. R4-39-08]AZF37723.1 hypothetical protein C4J88_2943 [Pseudomonas sp. R4-39-08]